MIEPRVVLYMGDGCSLCEDARAMLDEMGIAYETAADAAFVERIPVVTVDGAIVTEGRVSRRAVVAAVRRSRRRSDVP